MPLLSGEDPPLDPPLPDEEEPLPLDLDPPPFPPLPDPEPLSPLLLDLDPPLPDPEPLPFDLEFFFFLLEFEDLALSSPVLFDPLVLLSEESFCEYQKEKTHACEA